MNDEGVTGQQWSELALDYERARQRSDSLDSLVEWPAQLSLLGDVTGKRLLDLGCGNGGKLAELMRLGAVSGVGVDISGNFITDLPESMQLVQADLNDLALVGMLPGRMFDRVLFLQSFGYVLEPVAMLRRARDMLSKDGFILLSRTQPIRYALERAEQNGTSLGEEYFSSSQFSYRSMWNEQIALTKRAYTMSDLINTFSAAGLWIETVVEPQMSVEDRAQHPHKQAWMDRYLGILIFKLRPLDLSPSGP